MKTFLSGKKRLLSLIVALLLLLSLSSCSTKTDEERIAELVETAKPYNTESLTRLAEELNALDADEALKEKTVSEIAEELYAEIDVVNSSLYDSLLQNYAILHYEGEYYDRVKEDIAYTEAYDLCFYGNSEQAYAALVSLFDIYPLREDWTDYETLLEDSFASCYDNGRVTPEMTAEYLELCAASAERKGQSTRAEALRLARETLQEAAPLESADPAKAAELYDSLLSCETCELPVAVDSYIWDRKNEISVAVDYQLATRYFEEGDYQNAADLFSSCARKDYLDSEEKGNEAAYRYAEELLQQEDTERAYSAFAALGAYADSAEKAKSCTQEFPQSGFLSKTTVSGENTFTVINTYEDPLLCVLTRVEGVKGSKKNSSFSMNRGFSVLPKSVSPSVNTPDYYSSFQGSLTKTDEGFVLFLMPGESEKVSLKKGYYKIYVSTGKAWFGNDKRFGSTEVDRYTTPTTKIYDGNQLQCTYENTMSMNRYDKTSFVFKNGTIDQ